MSRVLLIEDNEFNQDLIVRYLRLFNFEVETASDGLEGSLRARAEAEYFDVVLLDMNLPEIDGWDVARRLKADAATRRLPVIAVTAHAMVGDREKTLAAGCDDYVSKPIDFQSLINKIELLIEKNAAPCPIR